LFSSILIKFCLGLRQHGSKVVMKPKTTKKVTMNLPKDKWSQKTTLLGELLNSKIGIWSKRVSRIQQHDLKLMKQGNKFFLIIAKHLEIKGMNDNINISTNKTINTQSLSPIVLPLERVS
jgi:hypothetical protein